MATGGDEDDMSFDEQRGPVRQVANNYRHWPTDQSFAAQRPSHCIWLELELYVKNVRSLLQHPIDQVIARHEEDFKNLNQTYVDQLFHMHENFCFDLCAATLSSDEPTIHHIWPELLGNMYAVYHEQVYKLINTQLRSFPVYVKLYEHKFHTFLIPPLVLLQLVVQQRWSQERQEQQDHHTQRLSLAYRLKVMIEINSICKSVLESQRQKLDEFWFNFINPQYLHKMFLQETKDLNNKNTDASKTQQQISTQDLMTVRKKWVSMVCDRVYPDDYFVSLKNIHSFAAENNTFAPQLAEQVEQVEQVEHKEQTQPLALVQAQAQLPVAAENIPTTEAQVETHLTPKPLSTEGFPSPSSQELGILTGSSLGVHMGSLLSLSPPAAQHQNFEGTRYEAVAKHLNFEGKSIHNGLQNVPHDLLALAVSCEPVMDVVHQVKKTRTTTPPSKRYNEVEAEVAKMCTCVYKRLQIAMGSNDNFLCYEDSDSEDKNKSQTKKSKTMIVGLYITAKNKESIQQALEQVEFLSSFDNYCAPQYVAVKVCQRCALRASQKARVASVHTTKCKNYLFPSSVLLPNVVAEMVENVYDPRDNGVTGTEHKGLFAPDLNNREPVTKKDNRSETLEHTSLVYLPTLPQEYLPFLTATSQQSQPHQLPQLPQLPQQHNPLVVTAAAYTDNFTQPALVTLVDDKRSYSIVMLGFDKIHKSLTLCKSDGLNVCERCEHYASFGQHFQLRGFYPKCKGKNSDPVVIACTRSCFRFI